ncbi:hypothetical protein L596_017354 [Steinernema carpocapsae]|uniref:Uncharacterized protein n=1 Tax=Steinernema carpocapsae TaxID=34508 RepID=A0A4U5N1P2_STECR|nr:hypothetical protein L596_017354 [Steinernema carpocapsae]
MAFWPGIKRKLMSMLSRSGKSPNAEIAKCKGFVATPPISAILAAKRDGNSALKSHCDTSTNACVNSTSSPIYARFQAKNAIFHNNTSLRRRRASPDRTVDFSKPSLFRLKT